jgi:hypothetical protein
MAGALISQTAGRKGEALSAYYLSNVAYDCKLIFFALQQPSLPCPVLGLIFQ